MDGAAPLRARDHALLTAVDAATSTTGDGAGLGHLANTVYGAMASRAVQRAARQLANL